MCIRDSIKAREIQLRRFAPYPGIHCNAQMTPRLMKQFAYVEGDAMKILRQAMIQRDLSARAYDRILKVARTIADLDGSEQISLKHISEAINYRNLDRSSWGIVSAVSYTHLDVYKRQHRSSTLYRSDRL